MTTLTLPLHYHMPFGAELLGKMKQTLQEQTHLGLFFESSLDNDDIQVIDMAQTSVLFLNETRPSALLSKSDTLPEQRAALCDIAMQLSPHLSAYMHGSGQLALSAHGLVCYSTRTMGSGAGSAKARILNNARAHIFEASHHAQLSFQKDVFQLLKASAGNKTCEEFTSVKTDFQK